MMINILFGISMEIVRKYHFTSNLQHLTKHNFVTTDGRKVIDPTLESPVYTRYENYVSFLQYETISA